MNNKEITNQIEILNLVIEKAKHDFDATLPLCILTFSTLIMSLITMIVSENLLAKLSTSLIGIVFGIISILELRDLLKQSKEIRKLYIQKFKLIQLKNK